MKKYKTIHSESAMVLISVPVSPRPLYDSDMEVCEPEFANDPLVEKLNLVEKENEYLKEKKELKKRR